jgi:hypothetical protein
MSKIEVDKVDPRSGTALEIGTSGDTVTVPSGVGLTLTDSTLLLPTTINTDKIDPKSGTALELGTSGDTVTVPSGVGLTLTDSTLLLPTTITSTTEVKTNKISPATGTAFALGDSGDTFTVPAGATIVNSGTATGFGGGSWNLIKSLTASSDSTLSFVNGTADVVLDSTYNVYVFTFTNIHGSIINYSLSWNGSTDTGSNYNVSKTQFANRSWKCSASSGAPTDDTGEALYQSTAFATMNNSVGIDADEQCSGQMWLYNPGSSTFGKMYETHTNNTHSSDCLYKWITGGEIETTSAVDAIQFKLNTGNIDSGVISLYGISK